MRARMSCTCATARCTLFVRGRKSIVVQIRSRPCRVQADPFRHGPTSLDATRGSYHGVVADTRLAPFPGSSKNKLLQAR